MEDTVTVRITSDLAAWLKSTARKTGVPVSRLIRDQLERAKRETGDKPYLRYVGVMTGPPDLSSRKGYSKK